MRIQALSHIYCNGKSVIHTCYSLCQGLQDREIVVELWVPSCDPALKQDFIRCGAPDWSRRFIFRLEKGTTFVSKRLDRKFLEQLEPNDFAYLWPGTPLTVFNSARARGATVLAEGINCHQGTAKRILDDAFRRLDWPPSHGITDQHVANEREEMSLCDYIFAPSPYVANALLENGVTENKILHSSYGWAPEKFPNFESNSDGHSKARFLFAGRACVRKGIPFFLKAWECAACDGELVLAGPVYDDVANRCADILGRDDVSVLGNRDDMDVIYRSSDILVLPTLEEGSALVIYEAMGCGLPVLTTPMGAGEVVRNGIEGIVLEPFDTDAWIEAIRLLADNEDLRRQMGEAARLRSEHYTWDKVAARRRQQLKVIDKKSHV